jgi:hypothetical protein
VPVSSTATPEDDPSDVVAPNSIAVVSIGLGAAIDADDLGDVWALMSRTDADLAGFHRILPAEAPGDARFGSGSELVRYPVH